MAKGHLLISPPPKPIEPHFNFNIVYAVFIGIGIQLGMMSGYLLHLVCSATPEDYGQFKPLTDWTTVVVSLMTGVVLLTVFGLVYKRIWMIIPNVICQLALLVIFIERAVYVGNRIATIDPAGVKDERQRLQVEAYVHWLRTSLALLIISALICLAILALTAIAILLIFKYNKQLGNEPKKAAR